MPDHKTGTGYAADISSDNDDASYLRAQIVHEPSFRVTTLDGSGWICPYTLSVVPAPFDVAETAVAFLLKHRPWSRLQPRTIDEIHAARWMDWLNERYEQEPRLRFYGADGRWLNPFTAEWIANIPDPATSPIGQVMAAMARHLSTCAPAQRGRLISSQQLTAMVGKTRIAPSSPRPTTQTWLRGLMRGLMRTSTSAPPVEPAAIVKASPTPSTSTLFRARSVIERMLPPIPTLPGFSLAVHYQPLQEVGGDFYDFIDLGNERMLIMLADVSGHGPEAALVVSAGLKALRMLAVQHGDDLVSLLVAFNDNLRPDLHTGHFITCWAAVLDHRERTLTSLCAGHHPAMLCNVDRRMIINEVGKKGAAIGVIPGHALRATLHPETIQLMPGDLLLQFTDGLHEVRDAAGNEFGRVRVSGSCATHLDEKPSSLVKQLVADAKTFAGGPLHDDLTVLAIKLDPA